MTSVASLGEPPCRPRLSHLVRLRRSSVPKVYSNWYECSLASGAAVPSPRPPTLTPCARAKDRILCQFADADDFVAEVPLPAAALPSGRGEVFVESDFTFVPDDRLRNGDRRVPGLRIWDVTVN